MLCIRFQYAILAASTASLVESVSNASILPVRHDSRRVDSVDPLDAGTGTSDRSHATSTCLVTGLEFYFDIKSSRKSLSIRFFEGGNVAYRIVIRLGIHA